MGYWQFSEIFGGRSDSEEPSVSHIELGGMVAIPIDGEKMEQAQDQVLKNKLLKAVIH